MILCVYPSKIFSELVLPIYSQWYFSLWSTWLVPPPVWLYQWRACSAACEGPSCARNPACGGTNPPAALLGRRSWRLPMLERDHNFWCTKLASAWSVIWWTLITCPTPNTEIWQVSCSENREIVSPCVLIPPNAFDLGSAYRLHATVSFALCISHQAGRGCLCVGLISLSAMLLQKAVIAVQRGEVCRTPRSPVFGDPTGARCLMPTPECPLHPSMPHDLVGTPGISLLAEACLSQPLSIKECLQILHDTSTSTWYILPFPHAPILNAGLLK